jgi:signal transduction histidine kinase
VTSEKLSSEIERSYDEETAAIIRGRLPYATVGFILSFAIAWVFEHQSHPERDLIYGIIFALEIVACALAIVLTALRLLSPRASVPLAILTTISLIVLVNTYHIAVGGEAEILGIALGYINVAVMLLFPWGGLGQLMVAGVSLGAYIVAVDTTVRAAVQLELSIIGQAFIGSLTVLGAIFMERYRRGFLRQKLELRRTNEALRLANDNLQMQITERQRANDETSGLLDVARDISGPLDWHEILERVHERVAKLLPCDRLATFYFDRDSRAFRVIAHHGVPRELQEEAEAVQFPMGDAVSQELAQGRSLVINDIHHQTSIDVKLLERFGIRTLAAVPLLVRGRTLGVMTASRNLSAAPFTSNQVRWLEGVCQHLAVARETAEFHQVQREEARSAAGLAKLAGEMISSLSTPVILDRLCRLTTELLDCDCSHTFLLVREKNVYVAVSGYGDSSHEAESLRVLEVPPSIIDTMLTRLQHDGVTVAAGTPLAAAARDEHGELCIALRRGEEIVGIQTAGYRRRVRHFNRWQLQTARRIGEIASLALENGRLFEQLGRANRMKSDFLATVSHEFRTPLNVILGYCDLLLEGAFGRLLPEQTDNLDRVRSNARQLLDLINATLDVTRLDGGKLPLELAPVHVWDLVEEIDEDTRDLRERKPEVHMIWNVPTNLPVAVTDQAKLKVILKNLIGNAIKFTARGTVKISATPSDSGLEFAVADTGIGVPRDVQTSIFEPFQQANGQIVDHYGGVGLGLYIVRRLCELLGGHVSVQSEEGNGSTFRVWIPLDRREAHDDGVTLHS